MDRSRGADYGIDAPGVVRNLLVAGVLGILAWWWQLRLPVPGTDIQLDFTGMGSWLGIGCTGMAVWMLWDSRIGKRRKRERQLDRIAWTGAEQVLDVGCGRGLMLVGAARRLTSGTATGIDVWQGEDLSGNEAGAALQNAGLEGVADRVRVQTADMRHMPFAPESFDVIVSRAAIHNLYRGQDRAQAIGEIVRVLKPGGHVLIDDIRHIGEYADLFARAGCADVRRYGSRVLAALLAVLTFGSLCPGILVVRK
jgi:arsenite methyltransferase